MTENCPARVMKACGIPDERKSSSSSSVVWMVWTTPVGAGQVAGRGVDRGVDVAVDERLGRWTASCRSPGIHGRAA